MSDYRVTVKVQNNNIIKRILDAGYKTVGEFCRLNPSMRTFNSTIGDIINMKSSPFNQSGDFKTCIKSAAMILECLPEDFFTENQLNTALETNKRVLEVEEAELQFMLENKQVMKSLEQSVYETERTKAIDNALESLTPRECKVIEMRMGLGKANREHTLEEVGKVFGVTRDRIRQIEAKALRKLRHPRRREHLREFIQGEL
jgi:RNA polymerase sigma factor (sigma-70 family)